MSFEEFPIIVLLQQSLLILTTIKFTSLHHRSFQHSLAAVCEVKDEL